MSFCLQSASFILLSYIYLAWNGYYIDELCELFNRSSLKCSHFLTISGAIAHFIETFIYLTISIALIFLIYIIWRFMQLTSKHGAYNISRQRNEANRLETFIEVFFIISQFIK